MKDYWIKRRNYRQKPNFNLSNVELLELDGDVQDVPLEERIIIVKLNK